MTLPKSDELSEAAKKRGVTGFWYEAVDRQGGIVYRQVVEDPFLGMEVFDRDGKIRRVKAATHDEVGLEILVPDVPELEEIHIYSSTRPSKHETEIRDQGKAEHVATISLRGKEGGGYGASDGMVIGSAKLLNIGLDDQRMNIVLVAEGFRDTQQDDFDALCDEFVIALQAEPWYPAVGGAINVWKLNVSSTDEGADDPLDCPDEAGDGTVAATYFDATFCADNANHRCLAANWPLVNTTLTTAIPVWYAGAVIVNTPKRGGCASSGDRIFATGLGTHPDEKWTDIALHEFGHAAFNLADEYPYGYGNNAPGSEPFKPNITAATTFADLAATGQSVKLLWTEMVTPEVPIPTMENPDCTLEDESENILDNDFKIGLFEGAGYYHCGLYRPAYLCRMRQAKQPFCGVCIQGIANRLGTFITPTPRMELANR